MKTQCKAVWKRVRWIWKTEHKAMQRNTIDEKCGCNGGKVEEDHPKVKLVTSLFHYH